MTEDKRGLLLIVRDRDGNYWGPFTDPIEATAWIKRKWPGMSQDENREGRGWDIETLREPD